MIKNIKILLAFQLLFSTMVFAKNENKPFEYNSDQIQNVVAKSGEESAKINWSLDHDLYAHLKERNAKIIITYNTKLGKERHKEGLTGSDWKYTDPIDIDDISYEIEDLGGNTDYLFKVGFTTEGSLKEAKKDKEKMKVAYVCPMKVCNVKQDKPGKCPKCGMTLKEVKLKEGHDHKVGDHDHKDGDQDHKH